jgi:hypothetical protein
MPANARTRRAAAQMMSDAAVIFEFTKHIAENSSAMDLAIKPDHELVTKNLSGAIIGTQP